jgi:hypothetical protein
MAPHLGTRSETRVVESSVIAVIMEPIALLGQDRTPLIKLWMRKLRTSEVKAERCATWDSRRSLALQLLAFS